MVISMKVLLTPLPIVDYVITHEMDHLKVMDQSPRFWETLEMLDSAYR